MSLITASIVLFNNDKIILQKAILSFLNTTLNVKLFLIDNSKTDSLSILNNDPRIIYLHNPSNPGFGAAHNIAIKQSRGLNSVFHLVLNPDIYFDKGTLETIYLFMSNNPEFGLLMPKILNINNEIQFLCKTNPTFFDLLLRGFAPKFIKSFFSNRLDEYEYKRYDLNNIIHDVPYLSGCFMFFRTVEFDKVGLFDESFFMYMEDADISRRFSLDSKTIYFPFAKVNHYHNALSHKKMKYRLIAIYSAVLYFNKWGWKFF